VGQVNEAETTLAQYLLDPVTADVPYQSDH
jgi:hypothetical protein